MGFELSSSRSPAAHARAFSRFAGMRIAFARKACGESIDVLNQILADAMTLRDLYKKYYWQASGPAFYELHVLFDLHHDEQEDLIDLIAERIQALGGLCVAMAAEVAEITTLPSPPRNRETPLVQLARLIEAHKRVLQGVRKAAQRAFEIGDDGTHDLLAGDVTIVNEKQLGRVREMLKRGSRSHHR
jgi:starvation-inducible DNA-binding protein